MGSGEKKEAKVSSKVDEVAESLKNRERTNDDYLVIPTGGSVEGVVDRMALQTYTQQLTKKRFLRRLRRANKTERIEVMTEKLPTADQVFIEIFTHLAKSWVAQYPELELEFVSEGIPLTKAGVQLRVMERITTRLLELKYPDNS